MNADRADQALVGGDTARPSLACEEFIKAWEKCRLKPYRDQAGKWTAGWGHLMQLTDDPTTPITQAEADSLFHLDLLYIAEGVARLVLMPLRQYQFDALVCFAFNVGLGALATSTLRKRVNGGYFTEAADWFAPWNKCTIDGVLTVSEGLTKRRAAERAIFVNADYAGRP